MHMFAWRNALQVAMLQLAIPSLVYSDFDCGKLADAEDILEEMVAQLRHLGSVDGDASQVEMGCVDSGLGWVAGWLPGWQPDGLAGGG